MNTNIWLITAKTNLHAGNENNSSYGIIDNAVQRDALCGLPCINSSSLKGAVNEFCCHSGMPASSRKKIFGSDKNDRSDSQKGSSVFFDARILFLPVQDDENLFHYATSRDVLDMFKERAGIFSPGYLLPADNALQQKFGLCRKVEIISSESFKELCNDENLPIIARNVLDNGVSMNLWYEQVLPAETVLFSITCDSDDTLEKAINGKIIQIGANATIGYGYCKFTKI